jgi:hypothetical protein
MDERQSRSMAVPLPAVEDAMKTFWNLVVLSLELALLAVFTALPGRAQAEPEEPAPGEYLTEGGWGVLTISRLSDQTTRFALETRAPNGRRCGLAGRLLGTQGVAETQKPSPPCVVTFERQATGVLVTTEGQEACRWFCGVHAQFDAEYLTPQPGCSREAGRAACAQFKQLYAAQSYDEAAELLESRQTRCAKTLGLGPDCTLNDLAAAQYHLGRLADCRKTLEPLAADATRTDAELRALYPLTDLAEAFPFLRATRHNLKLCAEKEH